MRTCRKEQTARQRASGVAVIELAFTLAFLLLLMIGITELGRALWYYNALQKAVRDGARCVSISDLSTTAINACRTLVVSAATSAGVSPTLDRDKNVVCNGGTKPEYVDCSVKDYEMTWIWSLGEQLPAAGGTSPIKVQTTMPYMK